MGYRSYGNSQQGYLRTTKWQLGTDWRVFVSRDSWEIRRLGSQHTWWRVSQRRRNVEQTKRNNMASIDRKNDTDWRWKFRSCLCSEQVWFLFCHFLAACLNSIVIFIFIEFWVGCIGSSQQHNANWWFHSNNEHFMQTKVVSTWGTRHVPQITFLNVKKLNRIDFITVSSIALDLKYRLCFTNVNEDWIRVTLRRPTEKRNSDLKSEGKWFITTSPPKTCNLLLREEYFQLCCASCFYTIEGVVLTPT